MTLSLIICTRNRGARLGACLNALSRLEAPDGFELVIVDNGSTDNTADVLATFNPPFPVKVISEPAPGLARARNTGWNAARGDIIAFTDDDCYVEPDYARQIEALFERRSDIGWFGGRVMHHDPEDIRTVYREDTEEEEYPAYKFILEGTIHGANFGFRKAVLEGLGGFDTRLGAGTEFSAEDTVMVGKAIGTGHAGIYSPAPTVRHHQGTRSLEKLEKLSAFYRRGAVAYHLLMLRYPIFWLKLLQHRLKHYHLTKNRRSAASQVKRLSGEIVEAWSVFAKLRLTGQYTSSEIGRDSILRRQLPAGRQLAHHQADAFNRS